MIAASGSGTPHAAAAAAPARSPRRPAGGTARLLPGGAGARRAGTSYAADGETAGSATWKVVPSAALERTETLPRWAPTICFTM